MQSEFPKHKFYRPQAGARIALVVSRGSHRGLRADCRHNLTLKPRYQRAKTLIQNGDISQERFDEAEIQQRSAEARYQAAQDSFHNQTALVEHRVAELELARKQLQDTIIVAPIDGPVSARHVTRGEYIRAETQIVTLVRSNPLRLQAVVPEVAVASVRLNQPVTLSVDAHPARLLRVSSAASARRWTRNRGR